jgi:hypothetical protein
MGNLAQNTFKTPQQVMQERLAQQQAMYASAQSPYERMGMALGNILGGALGVKDPAMERASTTQSIYNAVLQTNPDTTSPAFYTQLANTLAAAGLGAEANFAMQEARKYQKENIELGIKQAKADRDVREAAQKNVKFYKENPDQAEFRIAELAQTLSTDPTNAAALKEYTEITRAASEGAIEAAGKQEKASVDLAKDKTLLAKYQKELADNAKLNPVDKQNNDIQASRDLLKVYGIDPTKPIKGQVTASVMMSAGSVLLRAQENALLKKTTEGGTPLSSTSADAPATAGGSSNVEARVKAAGLAYEPDKYEYRVLANGTVQRKKK